MGILRKSKAKREPRGGERLEYLRGEDLNIYSLKGLGYPQRGHGPRHRGLPEQGRGAQGRSPGGNFEHKKGERGLEVEKKVILQM